MYSSLRGESIFVIHSEYDNDILNELKAFFNHQLFYNANNNELTDFKVEYLDSKTGNYVGQVYSEKIKEKRARACVAKFYPPNPNPCLRIH